MCVWINKSKSGLDSKTIRTPKITFNGQIRDIHKVNIYHFYKTQEKFLAFQQFGFPKLIKNGKYKFT